MESQNALVDGYADADSQLTNSLSPRSRIRDRAFPRPERPLPGSTLQLQQPRKRERTANFNSRLHCVHGRTRSPKQAWAGTLQIQKSEHCPEAISSRGYRLALLPSFRYFVFAHRTPARHRPVIRACSVLGRTVAPPRLRQRQDHGHLIRVRSLIRLLHGARFIGRRYRRPNQPGRHYKVIRTPTPRR